MKVFNDGGSASFASIIALLTTIDADTGNIATDVAALEVLLTASNVDLAAMEVLLGTIDTDTSNIATDVAALEVLSTAANVDLAAMEVLLGTIDTDTGNIATDVAALEVLLTATNVDLAAMEIDLAAIEVINEDIEEAVQSLTNLPVTHWNPQDFTAAYASTTSITITGAPFTVADANCTIAYILYKPAAGTWQNALVNGQNGVSITSAADVITVAGAGTPFLAADIYFIGIIEVDRSIEALDNIVTDVAALEVLSTAANVDLAAIEVLLGTIDTDTSNIATDVAALEVLSTAANVDLAAIEVINSDIEEAVQQAVDIPVTHTSPADGAVAYTSNVTCTCTGFPFVVADANCTISYIMYLPSGGSWARLVNGQNGVSITSAANVIAVAGAGTPFAAADTYHVGLVYQDKGYTVATNSLRIEEIDPNSEKYVEEELVDTTDLSADTRYYPSSAGLSMGGYKDLAIQFVISGGVTMTVEATIDDSGTPDWLDITPAGYELITNASGGVSFVDTSGILDFDNLNVKLVRVKSVTSDATNGVQYHCRRKA